MKKVILLLGGNMGDRKALIGRARLLIEDRAGKIVRSSAIYESAPWGFAAKQSFYNQVVVIISDLAPHHILEIILQIEKELGRERTGKNYSSRTMDIDILFYEQEIIDTPDLIIPHPQLHKRRFTLVPLNEILPDWNHPGLNQSIRSLLEQCTDHAEVEPIKE